MKFQDSGDLTSPCDCTVSIPSIMLSTNMIKPVAETWQIRFFVPWLWGSATEYNTAMCPKMTITSYTPSARGFCFREEIVPMTANVVVNDYLSPVRSALCLLYATVTLLAENQNFQRYIPFELFHSIWRAKLCFALLSSIRFATKVSTGDMNHLYTLFNDCRQLKDSYLLHILLNSLWLLVKT